MKDAPEETLADDIRRVVAGERVIDPELVGVAIDTGSTLLTPREADVLRAAESGISTEEVADNLSLSPQRSAITFPTRSARWAQSD